MGFKVNDFIDKKMGGMPILLQYGITPLLVNEAKKKAYWKDRSSHARNSINGGVEGGNGEFTLYLAHGSEYGGWLEEGTGIYGPTKRKIVPVNKKILSWVDEDGKRHFAKSVQGIKPMPILHDTLNNNESNIANRIIKYWSD
ncbi:hypothetical protein [Clostridium beijerinckii]|uniref:hypothetical protein n=1 Tax=Clostridium beijerinckii TaxID=1520 RepID=UPI0003D2DA25|nr:hypothetical protein [Clostridium beijerinckii]ALB46217.1 hypothetical protein X276_13705 [Clostridium beijerinckii NRRL B-598]